MTRLFSFLESRVSRRVLALFVVGAVVPVLVMAALSYRAVRSQLLAQAEDRLEQLAETAGQSVVQRLLVVEQGLERVAHEVAAGRDSTGVGLLPAEVDALGVQTLDGGWRTLAGGFAEPPAPLSPSHRDWVASGGTALRVVSRDPTTILAVRETDPGGGAPSELLWASLVGDSIWGAARVFSSLPEVVGFCVADAGGVLTCDGRGRGFVSAVDPERDRKGTRQVSMSDGEYVVGYRQFFLEAAFATPPWAVLLAEVEDGVYAPADAFAFSFVLALAVGVLTVLLLASSQVRRTLGPLQALEEGTRRIAQGEFAARVTAERNDEFGALAHSFNRMADDLSLQFEQLAATAAIGERVLTSGEREPVVKEILERFLAVTPTAQAAILLLPRHATGQGELWWKAADGQMARRELPVSPMDEWWLTRDEPGVTAAASAVPPYVEVLRRATGAKDIRSLPFFNLTRVRGGLLYEPRDGVIWGGSTLDRARQVADQAALALHEIQLVEELDDMNLGAMRALARAIDAKSQWTAGHSERVTEMSLGLATVMGLSQEDHTLLQRGGLLHDIGKIGIPSRVLDTEGVLSEADWQLIRTHPTVGARILEPIGPFGPMLPIVLQHHERWDGGGYPAGLRQDEIHPLARVLAVADTYDAITSVRPYRQPVPPEAALDEIVRNAGLQFEPDPVEAFVALMEAEGIRPTASTR